MLVTFSRAGKDEKRLHTDSDRSSSFYLLVHLRTTMEQRREKQGLTVQANLGEMKQIGMGSHRDDRKYSELTYVYTRFDILICKNDLCKLYSQCALVFG